MPHHRRLFSSVLLSSALREHLEEINSSDPALWANDDKATLVTRILACDKHKGKKAKHIVTAYNKETGETVRKVQHSARTAPGAEILDHTCKHGGAGGDLQEINMFCGDFLKRLATNFKRLFDDHAPESEAHAHDPNGAEARYILLNFFMFKQQQDRLPPVFLERVATELWAIAVGSACSEIGNSFYARLCVGGSLMAYAIATVLKRKGNFGEADERNVYDNPELAEELKSILTDGGLWVFMHEPKHRRCDCMRFMAMAVEMGVFAGKKSKEPKMKPARECNHCGKSKVKMYFCSGCSQVSYCNADCQKKDWKPHKAACKAFQKAAADTKKAPEV